MTPQQMLEKLKGLGASFTTTQLASLAASFAIAVLLVAGSAWWLSRPSYALLFADMDPEAASDILTKLDAQKVQYTLDAGGRNIRVPASQVDRLRLELSAQGLPSSGRIGFEIFDRTAFGQTEFLEQVNYRRALEGEIARTIGTISEVASARVHIAMAKESLFGAKEQPAKASVILKLRSSRPLPGATVQGITNLVAASVEGLRPEAVVVMDSFGRPLARPAGDDDGTPLGSAEVERQQRIEHELAARVVSLLEPVVGENRVRANVAVRLSPDSEERTEEKWDPTAPVVRSHQQTSDVTPVSGNALGGIAGARANLPPTAPSGTPPAPANGAPTAQAAAATAATTTPPPGAASRTSETTNYEISRTTLHTIRPRGDIARLSVAVVVDDVLTTSSDKSGKIAHATKPRSPAELQKLQQLVSAAVGVDTGRGDQLTVENISFDQAPAEDVPAPTFLQKYGDDLGEVGRLVTLLGVVGLVLAFVVRPLLAKGGVPAAPRAAKKALAAAGPAGQLPAPVAGQLRSVSELESEIEAQLDAVAQQKTLENLRVPVLQKKAADVIQNQPERAARLMRSWLTEEDR